MKEIIVEVLTTVLAMALGVLVIHVAASLHEIAMTLQQILKELKEEK